MRHDLDLGATYVGDGECRFLVWAPFARKVEVRIVSPRTRIIPMESMSDGYHRAVVGGVRPGTNYVYRLDGHKERPDPASRFQPAGVHGPSQVVDSRAYAWRDRNWFGLPLSRFVFYELHVGTYTPEGTFSAIVPYLDRLRELGITGIELMPVAQFPGERNWGYDGVYPYAVQSSYGGPDGLKRLVDACHVRGLAVVLDVVYNHLGPEGNYLRDYGPYFTDGYKTPWGEAINFDNADSDDVRRFFIQNALYWLEEYHLDALRLDAIHAIKDFSAYPFLEELAVHVHGLSERLNWRLHLIAESDLNDARVIRPRWVGGYGLDAQWSDDFHHALHALLTGEQSGYYLDFGRVAQLAKVYRNGYVYSGQHSPFRRRRHGNSPQLNTAEQFVVCAQNHDQVGNRMLGDRLTQLVSFESLKLAAGVTILSPFLPLLFMGEEYGETAPFQYFTSHSDPDLVEAVRKGRREEFAEFDWAGEVPDPQDEATFQRSKIRHELSQQGQHRALWELHRELLRLRREVPALSHLSKEDMEVVADERAKVLLVRRWAGQEEALVLCNFSESEHIVGIPLATGDWRKELDSADERWLGDGSPIPRTVTDADASVVLRPRSFVLLARTNSVSIL